MDVGLHKDRPMRSEHGCWPLNRTAVLTFFSVTLLAMQLQGLGQGHAAVFQQIPYAQEGHVVEKLTRAYTWSELGRLLIGTLGSAASFSYRDPDTQDKVDLLVVVDPRWNRIVWSTSYHGETRVSDFGSYGSGTTQMNSPSDLAIGSNGNLYVADTGNRRVKVFGWIADYIPNAERYFALLFNIPGGTDFSYPNQVLWDDNGTPASAQDDILWVMDRLGATIVGYHITYTNPGWTYSLYVKIDFKQVFQGANRRYLTSFTKGRATTSPSQAATYCTEDLIAYDAANRCFLKLTVPRVSGTITSPATQIALTTTPNPVPGMVYTELATDAWGNIVGLDRDEAKLTKFTGALQVVGSYGSRGSGGIGTQQMLSPQSVTFHIDKPAGAVNYLLTKQAVLGEMWSDQTGVQSLEAVPGVDAPDVTHLSGSANVKVGVHSVDHGRLRLRILNGDGFVVQTLADQDIGAGRSEFIWNGCNNAGVPVGRCRDYTAEARVTGFYSSTDVALASTSFNYKPLTVAQVRIESNVPGSRFSFDGRDTTVAGNFAVYPCSLCTVHSPRAPAVQTISGTKYCFDRWSNGGYRTHHDIQVRGDSTVSLSLTSGSGPTYVGPDSTLFDDAYDCKSPYVFAGSATLTTSNPVDTFRTWGNVKFRVEKSVGAALNINRPLIARGVRFETVDSTANAGTNLWEGLRLAANGSLFLDSCFVRNAKYGILTSAGCTGIANLSIERSSFDYNQLVDVSVGFDWSRTPTARVVGNKFHSVGGVVLGVGGTSPSLVANATIQDNYFYTATPFKGELTIVGGWSGTVTGNTFTVNLGNAIGLLLSQYVELGSCGTPGSYASPSVMINNNDFNILSGGGRLALKTPGVTSVVSQINAHNNDWNYYTADQIRQVIVNDGTDGGTLAIAQFQPFTTGGGGGGGGGGGCPFVLTESGDELVVENSILGRSLVTGSAVSDAYPLRIDLPRRDGKVRLRIGELGTETDEIDEVKLVSILVPEGYELGSDGSGRPILFKPSGGTLLQMKWTGKDAPFVSPIAPGGAYRGGAGDSLEFRVDDDGTIVFPGKRRFGINLIPKPTSAPLPGSAIGVTLRVSPDAQGDRWVTLDGVIPRENWSSVLVPLDGLGDLPIRRVRVIWHTAHTLGWANVVSGEPAPMESVPFVSALHSDGGPALEDLGSQDGQNLTLLPGEHVDLEFDVSRVPETARLVLLTHGRYFQGNAAPAPAVPKVYTLAQNRPNPFNPSTAIEFGLPTPSRTTLRVYDVAGRLVRTIIDRYLPAGFHTAKWEGRNERGGGASSGVYFYELRAGSFIDRRRMVLLR